MEAAAVAGMTIQEVRPPEEALTDPLFVKDGCVTEINDPELGAIRQVGVTYRLAANPSAITASRGTGGRAHRVRQGRGRGTGRQAGAAQPKSGRKLGAPLGGMTVLDLGLAIAGPYGTQILSDLGADVIKINALYDTYWHSNHIRLHGQPRQAQHRAGSEGSARACRSLRQLVEKADVVQHNMRYDAAERLGIDYESLKAINPKLHLLPHARL